VELEDEKISSRESKKKPRECGERFLAR